MLCIAGLVAAQDKKDWDVAEPTGEWNFKELN